MSDVITIKPYLETKDISLDILTDIRVEAMKESLTNIGRFNEERARDRLIKNFQSKDCYLIFKDEQLAGFFIYYTDGESIKLDHLYIKRTYQGLGLGSRCFDFVKKESVKYGKNIHLYALKGSRSNNFYQEQGCIQVAEEEFDNVYNWSPDN